MSRVDIVHLESYRKRRDARFQRALVLNGDEADRSRILHHLARAIDLVGADRSALVWIDEYGPGLVHPHTVLDLGAERPRRAFSPLPLRTAWDTRVPGLLDLPRTEGRWEKLGEGIASACCVALGSDGPRSWFLAVDSLTPRQPLTDRVAGELMFLAGEVASVVLHRDLQRRPTLPGPGGLTQNGSDASTASFPGWPVLQDLEGRSRTDPAGRRIGKRFLVARLVRGLVDDHFAMDAESVTQQVRGIRRELRGFEEGAPETRIWDEVLSSVPTWGPV